MLVRLTHCPDDCDGVVVAAGDDGCDDDVQAVDCLYLMKSIHPNRSSNAWLHCFLPKQPMVRSAT